MKCFYHLDRDAVGTCSQCGKAACRECIEDVRGVLLCRGCLLLHIEEMKREEEADEIERRHVVETAIRRLRWSWIVFAGFSISGLVIGFLNVREAITSGDPQTPSTISLLLGVPLISLLAGYFFWGLYWGVPAVWRWWRGIFENIGCTIFANPVTLVILIFMFFYVPLVFGYMYGVLGGGFYEFAKSSKLANQQPTSSLVTAIFPHSSIRSLLKVALGVWVAFLGFGIILTLTARRSEATLFTDQAKNTSSSSYSPSESIQAPVLQGQWDGKVNQSGYPPYSIQINLKHCSPGQVCGSVNYPEFQCSGKLTSLGVVNGEYRLRENINKGLDRCVAEGEIALRQIEGGSWGATILVGDQPYAEVSLKKTR